MLELSNLCHCVQHPWKLTSRDFWSSRNKRKWLSKHKCVLRKCCGVSQKWWMLELSNLCHCVQHPWKLTSRDFWSSRNERKPLSKQKCVLRKCCEVSQKWWMLELSNLCHCVQHPWKLTSRDFWRDFWRNVGKSVRYQECWELSNLWLCSSPWKLTSRDFWSSRNERKHFLKCVLRKCCGVSQKWWVLELSNLCHCVQHSWKLTSRDFWSSRNKESHFLSKNVFWRNAVGYLRNGEC